VTPEVRAKLNRPGSIDIVFANGGLTSHGGHPAPLHDYLASLGVFKGLGPAQMENRAYFLVDSEAELDAKWPRILAGHPDFIKTFLLFSEAFEGREPLRRETDGKPNKGLDPRVLAAIVARAHAAGLRVSTHIDTVRDFENAVNAGVDESGPLAGAAPRGRLAEDGQARQGVAAVDLAHEEVREGAHEPRDAAPGRLDLDRH